MKFAFAKMHGAGNDFVVVEDPGAAFPVGSCGDAPDPLVRAICARHTGIACEGLTVLQRANAPEGTDFRMVFFNPDGSRASMCGNGARCAAAYSCRKGWTGRTGAFATDAGTVPFEIISEDGPAGWTVSVGIKDVASVVDCGALSPDGSGVPLPAGFDPAGTLLIDTGVPHAVKFCPDVAAVDVAACGAFVRYHSRFAPAGTNADFVQVAGPHEIVLRTYERGVEAETPACGTGIAAAAVASMHAGFCKAPVAVRVAFGATLSVDCASLLPGGGATGLRLVGPAAFTCVGELETDWFSAG
ncbi:MAG: diaminopimelate epimerase [Kiritimatiellae bacterium]|nr:diaminopimelate epimerase [Kiritimatiellia bacterium]